MSGSEDFKCGTHLNHVRDGVTESRPDTLVSSYLLLLHTDDPDPVFSVTSRETPKNLVKRLPSVGVTKYQ